MDLQEVLHNAVENQRNERLKSSPQLTLGELILKLKVFDSQSKVFFDFDDSHPTRLDSWRGSYCELAINYDSENNLMTVERLLVELESAVGNTYQGYKGGEFKMGRRTPIWADNYGKCTNKGIVDVVDDDKGVIIQTAQCEF